jgi:pantoate--beta-alanine ligase
MEIATTLREARELRRGDRDRGQRVALVPTMGALHAGHLSLVRRAREAADRVWVSVFVNPAQFGPGEDLERYPRDLARDTALLREAPADVLFAPSVAEMYPRPPVVRIGFCGLDEVLCGAERPGHFAGVGLVVAKLLNIVQPDLALFGQKDAQQALLVRRLVEDLSFPVSVEVRPTVREADGLAMSSRNAYLGPGERRAATAIFRALLRGRDAIASGTREPRRVETVMAEEIAGAPELRLEYAACVGAEDLARPARIEAEVLLAIAARAGSTRLIDNLPVTVAALEGRPP